MGAHTPVDVSPEHATDFRARVWAHYRAADRGPMPWRETRDPYRVLVSEVMLQQTQVSRVVPVYERFVEAFPTAEALAAAPLDDVLRVWRGLGYNRRAVSLRAAAERVVAEHRGQVPRALEQLRALRGVGPATAAGVRAFAFGEPGVYIETNVRAALLHEFFGQAEGVRDAQLAPVYEAVFDRDQPREWLFALMDYGAHVKRAHANPSRRSAHHTRQTPFEGSRRQKRARLLHAVVDRGQATAASLASELGLDTEQAEELLSELEAEGFLARDGRHFRVR